MNAYSRAARANAASESKRNIGKKRKMCLKKKKVAEDHPFHLSNQAVLSVGHVGALQRRVAPPATAPTLPPAVTHAGARLNTGSARPAALMLQP